MFGGFGAIADFRRPDHPRQVWSQFSIGGKPFEVLGYKGFFLTGAANDATVLTLFLFQMVFMDTAATIPTGAMAERWKFSAFVVYGFFLSMLIYPVYGCWVWGGGWLADLGVNFGLGNGHVDFAGSSVVHMTGGVTGPGRGLDPRPADRQVQQGRLAQRHPGPRRPDGRARDPDPGLRLVRVQPGQHPGRHRPPHRLDRRLHDARHRGRLPHARCSTCGPSSASPTPRWPATACSPAPSRSPPRAPSSDPVGAVIIGADRRRPGHLERPVRRAGPQGRRPRRCGQRPRRQRCLRLPLHRPLRQRRLRRGLERRGDRSDAASSTAAASASLPPRRSASWPTSSGSSPSAFVCFMIIEKTMGNRVRRQGRDRGARHPRDGRPRLRERGHPRSPARGRTVHLDPRTGRSLQGQRGPSHKVPAGRA